MRVELQRITLSGEKRKKQLGFYTTIHLRRLKIHVWACVCIYSVSPFGHSAKQQGDDDEFGEARAVEGLGGRSGERGLHPAGDVWPLKAGRLAGGLLHRS